MFFSTSLFSQHPECGFAAFVFSGADYQDTNEELKKLTETKTPVIAARNQMIIPVVVHIVWKTAEENISDEAILKQIAILNQDFNGENQDIEDVPDVFQSLIAEDGIRFCLAKETPEGMPTTGILRVKTDIDFIGAKDQLYFSELGGSSAWNSDRYLNIWVAEINDFVTGFGTFPNQVVKEKDGVVIHSKYFGENNSNSYGLGRVCVHEVGHYLGLNHTWGNDSSCMDDDGVEDTPLQSDYYIGCPVYPQSSCGGEDLFMNFMDYVDDNCMVMFTKGQMLRMKTSLEVFRSGLLENNADCSQNPSVLDNFSFNIYPNPTKDKLTIIFPVFSHQLANIEIFDATGKRVYQSSEFLSTSIITDVSAFNPGIYYVKINNVVKKLLAF